MLSLFHSTVATVATDQLVYSADEVGSLDTLIEKINLLNVKLIESDDSIQRATTEAVTRGEQQGRQRGRAIARRRISLALLASQREIIAEKARLRDTSVELALEIVRRIGLSCSTPDTLVSLAMHSAKELHPDTRASLLVHPLHEVAVKERLSCARSENADWLLDVQSDKALSQDDCVLKTEHGSLRIGLESQLRVIERSLHERIG